MDLSVDQAGDKPRPRLVVLERCDKVGGLLPVCDGASVDAPQSDRLV